MPSATTPLRPRSTTATLGQDGPVLLATKPLTGLDAPVAVARWLAERDGSELRVVSILEPIDAAVAPAGVVPLAESVITAARECGARVIVVGTGRHDPIGRYVYGERALEIVARADRPVLVVPRDAVATALSVAVVAVDFSPASVRAAMAVLPLLSPAGRLVVVHVKPGATLNEDTAGWWNDSYERRCADLFAQFLRRLPHDHGVTLESKFLRGDVVSTVLHYAAAQGAGLIACGRLGHSLIERVLVGSVSSALIRQATLPVLIAPELPGDGTWR